VRTWVELQQQFEPFLAEQVNVVSHRSVEKPCAPSMFVRTVSVKSSLRQVSALVDCREVTLHFTQLNPQRVQGASAMVWPSLPQ